MDDLVIVLLKWKLQYKILKDKGYTDKMKKNILPNTFLLSFLHNWNFYSVFLVKSKLKEEGVDYDIRLIIGAISFSFAFTGSISLAKNVEPRVSIFHGRIQIQWNI